MTQNSLFEKVRLHKQKKLPFVIYKKPNSFNVIGQLQQTNKLYVDLDFKTSGFVFSPFNNEKEAIWFPDEFSERIESQLTLNETSSSYFSKDVNQEEAKQKHITTIEKALYELKSKKLEKVIISRVEIQDIDKIRPVEWFLKMVTLYPNTFCYCWYHPQIGMWLGATPETLVNLKQNKFETMALAGTMPYQGSLNVLWGDKEKEEQQFVVNSILKTLKPFVSDLIVGETSTQKAGSLLHLKTTLSGELLNSKHIKYLVDVLHPTSAVCGIPKEKAKVFILENEGYDRSYYTGYLGIFNPEKSTHLFVNLRCMQIDRNQVKIYIGGGITALSNPEQEWLETVNKSQIMKAIL